MGPAGARREATQADRERETEAGRLRPETPQMQEGGRTATPQGEYPEGTDEARAYGSGRATRRTALEGSEGPSGGVQGRKQRVRAQSQLSRRHSN